MKKGLIRQGDVLLVPVRSIPEGAAPRARDNGRVILAYGEVTGHAHAIADTIDDPACELLATGDATYLRVDRVSQLVHEEHSAAKLAPGAYRVVRQREYQPDQIRQVAD